MQVIIIHLECYLKHTISIYNYLKYTNTKDSDKKQICWTLNMQYSHLEGFSGVLLTYGKY